MATRSFQQQAAVGRSFSARNWPAASKPACLVRGPGMRQDGLTSRPAASIAATIALVAVAAGRGLVGAADHGDALVAERDQVIGGKPGAVGIVAAEDRHLRAFDGARDQHRRQAVLLGHDDVFGRRADGRRHDDAVGAELQQRVDEGALLFELVVMVGQDEGLPAAVELALDRAQDLGEERVHDVVHDDADDARARGAQAGGAAVVDIADGARMVLDAVARGVGNERAVAQRQRYGRRRDAKRIGDRRKLDLLCQYDLPPCPRRIALNSLKVGLCHRIPCRSKLFCQRRSSSALGAVRLCSLSRCSRWTI